MHVSALFVDLNWLFQLVLSLLFILAGFLYILKNTASKYFVVDGTFDSPSGSSSKPTSASLGRTGGVDMNSAAQTCSADRCAVCGKANAKNCARCKAVKYCSVDCQTKHWSSGHQKTCKELKALSNENSKPTSTWRGLALVPSIRPIKAKKVDKVLYPYDDFVYLFNWDKGAFPPCGLLNCGNSCYANVILQCLAHTRPLVAYLLERGHKTECRRNGWCFFCELQHHIERAIQSQHPFSPINILSRLPSIGSNLGYGRQEDAHEFMRFAIDTMQSVCLDEHGGEKMIHPKSQETTIIQHIFGGQLQSQVICSRCSQVSNQYENMMDLTVEIQGNATSLEECLDQFTAKEWLEGDNLYKCDRCNDYVRACKRLTIRQAPNILTIALKRFESGRFGKLNKRIMFPENLDLTPYMSEEGDGMDKYKLFAVVVHIDMLNASFFGHYICYTKDFQGFWYRIDDSKVARVELDEVLSQGAYMLLYSRVCARPTCLKTFETSGKQRSVVNGSSEAKQKTDPLNSDSIGPTKSHRESNCLASQATPHSNGSLIQEETYLQPAAIEIEVVNQDPPAVLKTFDASGKQRPIVDDLSSEAQAKGMMEPYDSDSESVVPAESHTESSSLVSEITSHANGSLIQELYLHPAASEIEAEDQDQTSLPVSRNVEVVENEGIAVDHTDSTANALVSSPSEAQTMTLGPLSNGSCSHGLSPPDHLHSTEKPLMEVKSETELPISNGEAGCCPSVDACNGTSNGFGNLVCLANCHDASDVTNPLDGLVCLGNSHDGSAVTNLDPNYGNSNRSQTDVEVESAGTTGAVNLQHNGISSCYPACESDSSINGIDRDNFYPGPQTQNGQHLNDMEVDPVEFNGSANLKSSLASSITLDTRSSQDCNTQDMQCSTAVKKSRRDVDDMDIDETCVT